MIAQLQWILIGRQHKKQDPKHQDMAVCILFPMIKYVPGIIRYNTRKVNFAKLLKSKYNGTVTFMACLHNYIVKSVDH